MQKEVRLNKYLSEAGLCSRRMADKMIEAGEITVDGKPATVGMKVFPEQTILVKGRPFERMTELVLLAVNKPVGIVCTTDKRWGDQTVEDMLQYPQRIFSVGRLDKASEGLLLMTNNGDILNKIMRAGNYHEKEYEVTVNKPITESFLKDMAAGGIMVMEQKTRPCVVEQLGKRKFRIILTQGLNRQIRRMCEACGYSVVKLCRIRIMNIHLGHLKPGAYRNLTEREIKELYEQLQDSSSNSKYRKR